MGESRTELLAWLNDLLQVNYTKVEQAGTGKEQKEKSKEIVINKVKGAAYCQIMDSIFGNVSNVHLKSKYE